MNGVHHLRSVTKRFAAPHFAKYVGIVKPVKTVFQVVVKRSGRRLVRRRLTAATTGTVPPTAFVSRVNV
jgi:hypothetical protein